MESAAVETLKSAFFAVFCFVTYALRNNCRPVRNSGSCLRIPCKSEIAYPKFRSSIAATAFSQWLRN